MSKRLTRAQAIRAKCLDCCCQQVAEVTNCPCEDCPIWYYRFGKSLDIREKQLAKGRARTAAKAASLPRKREPTRSKANPAQQSAVRAPGKAKRSKTVLF